MPLLRRPISSSHQSKLYFQPRPVPDSGERLAIRIIVGEILTVSTTPKTTIDPPVSWMFPFLSSRKTDPAVPVSIKGSKTNSKTKKYQSVDAQPLHPQLTHWMSWSSLSWARGTRQMHVELKFVSLVWMQRRQQSFS